MPHPERTSKRAFRARALVILLVAYLGLAFAGGLFLLTSYFDESHPPPLSTPQFLVVVFLVGPVALLVYGALEAVCEVLVRASAGSFRWLLRILRSRRR